MRHRRTTGALLSAVLVMLPRAAFAHNPLPGLEGFYVGLLHPLSTPDQILVLVATGLVLGSFALPSLIPAFGVLILGLLGGLILGQRGDVISQWLFAWASIVAAWAALFPGRGLAVFAGLTLVSGFGLGWASVPGAGPALPRLTSMAGSLVGAALLIFYLTGAVEYVLNRFPALWLQIGLRVLAAWVAALAIMMLAFETVGPAPR